MTELIDTVAELTHLRDHDALEASLARAIFELAGAARLSVWRAMGGGEGRWLRERLTLPRGHKPGEEILLAHAPPEWRECYAAQRYIWGPAAAAMTRHVFPLCNDREVTGLLEVLRPSPLQKLQEHLVDGLVRVYRNHLGLLDYGARDELTGLLNRRTFNAFFKQNGAGSGIQTAIAVADIDFFKRINDQFGHPYGDEVLILLSRLIAESFPGRDGLFRFGGEEFVVMLSDASQEEALVALDCFRAAVQEAVFPQVGQVTVSIGFSMILPGDTGACAFGRADEALYVAKHRGRNQVQCYELLVEDGSIARAKQAGGEMELF